MSSEDSSSNKGQEITPVLLLQYIDNDPVSVVEASDSHGNSLIHISSQDSKYVCVIEKLLTLPNININIRNSAGYSPLHFACLMNQKIMVSYLIEHGATLNEVMHQ